MEDFELMVKIMCNGMAQKKIPELYVKWTTDAGLIDVWAGSRSKKVSVGDRVTYENLDDYISPPDLLIVELGRQRTPNKAAAQVLEETLELRLNSRKPIWVINSLENRWVQGSTSWSELGQTLCSRMEQIHMGLEFGHIRNDEKTIINDIAFSKSEYLGPTSKKFGKGSRGPMLTGLEAMGSGIKPTGRKS
jgi:hypothetical protein